MPTYTVGVGKTYSTIQAAINAIPSNIAGTGVHEVVVDAGSYGDVLVVKSGSSASDYVHIRAASGSEHNGIYTSGVRITKAGFSGQALHLGNTPYSRATNLVCINSSAGDAISHPDAVTMAANGLAVNVIGITSNAGWCFGNGSGLSSCTYINCIAAKAVGASVRPGYGFNLINGDKAYNCGAYDCTQGFLRNNAATVTLNNCWAYNVATSAAFATGGTGSWSTSSNNASSDATAPGTNSLTNLTLAQFGFFSVTINNFHITRYSSIYNGGIDLSAIFIIDFDLQTRNTWSIGPDEPSTDYCVSDVYGYTAAVNSSPWSIPLGNPTIEASYFKITYNDIIARVAFNTTTGLAQTYTYTIIDVARNYRMQTWFNYNTFSTIGLPTIEINTGRVILNGIRFTDGGSPHTFGSWTNTDIGAAVNGAQIGMRVVYKQGTNELRALATYNGTTYDSGWVSVAGLVVNAYTWAFGSDTMRGSDPSVEYFRVSAYTWRANLSDTEADYFALGRPICGILAPDPYQPTSSDPWEGQIEVSDKPSEAKSATPRTQKGSPSPSTNSPSKTSDAKDFKPTLRSSDQTPPVERQKQGGREAEGYELNGKKGQRTGFISLMPELNGYGAATPGLGTGYLMPFMGETLALGKEFRDLDPVHSSRVNGTRRAMYQSPAGKVEFPVRSNDIVPLLQAHFQKRIGTTAVAGTTYYEFVPNKGRIALSAGQFGTGSYNQADTANAFSISAYKDISGNGILFKSGIVDKLAFKFHSVIEPSIEADFRFREGTLMGTQTSHPYGTYSGNKEFSPTECSVDFMGLPVIDFEFVSDNQVENRSVVGDSRPIHKFGQYRLRGKAVVDLGKTGLRNYGSVLSGSAFSVSATMHQSNHNRLVFDFPDCRISDFPIGYQSIYTIPFEAFASDNGSTAPVKVGVWTQNYSATSFQPY